MARATKSTEQTNPLVPLVAELGKDIGRMATAVETLVHQGNSTNAAPADNTSSTNTESHSTVQANQATGGGIQHEQIIQGILTELNLARQAQQSLTRLSGDWQTTLQAFSANAKHPLPTRETYGLRVYFTMDEDEFNRTLAIPVPRGIVGKTGYYRHRLGTGGWEKRLAPPMLFGETLNVEVFDDSGQSQSIDIEFFIINRSEFTPDEAIHL